MPPANSPSPSTGQLRLKKPNSAPLQNFKNPIKEEFPPNLTNEKLGQRRPASSSFHHSENFPEELPVRHNIGSFRYSGYHRFNQHEAGFSGFTENSGWSVKKEE